MRKFLCLFGIHKFIDYEFDFNQWWTGKGVKLICSCRFEKSFKTTKGLGPVRRMINEACIGMPY